MTPNLMESDYISRDDESEAKRLQDINGVGEVVTYLDPEDIKQYSMLDYGLGVE